MDKRGIIGLGEPPVVGGAAAIANAVANAIGTRVEMVPVTPNRVLAALAGRRA
jgi:xanthine dehydrogenase YagR molybdenum-binding subunit